MNLMEFLSGGPLSLKILTIDSSLYLPRLRQIYPSSILYAMTDYEEIVEKYKHLCVNWYLEKDMQNFHDNFFDIVISESVLTDTKNSYDDLMKINRSLKESGFFLGTFKNIRYAPILLELKEGRFPFRDEHLYAKDEIVKMLNDAIFKEIDFAPMERDLFSQNEADILVKLGFENYSDDLITKTWMFKAARATSAVLALKELYTEDTRKTLAKLLHRIEYDVEREKSLIYLWNLIEQEHIFPDYLLGFVEEITIYKKTTLKILYDYAKDNGIYDFATEIGEAIG